MAFSDSGFWQRAAGATGSALALFAATPAAAFWNDRFEVFASEVVTWDSNVFRISENLDPQRAIGAGGRSDRIHVHSLGATMDLPVSLQRFTAGYTWFATRYQRFDQLDFNGHVARANWLWAFTPRITGDIGATDSRALANFAIFRGAARDVVTSREAHANGNWALTPSWILYGGVVGAERKHDDPARAINDVRSTSVEARMTYVNAADNRLGVTFRREEGKSPNETVVLGTPFDNGYRQNGIGVIARWQVTGNSRFDGRAEYVRRDYDQFAERDYSGPTFRVSHNWTPTGKLTIVTTALRDIAPLDDIQTTFVLVKGVNVKPRWELTEKITIQGSADYSRWEYRASPAFGNAYSHRVRSAGVSVAYRPLRTVLLEAGVLREVRTSTLADADYSANVASLGARIGF
ncbi:MAG TPA: XrtB/PEP-CTERM-associated polysaccharide biosynthesis outer membrane protein EpsL [Usitatibacter sp.]|nr:XrtB/PEP-CTERM-associated polysaccharide biosynthesis outer membrane protein EpsL [Usitatibacter sp.]